MSAKMCTMAFSRPQKPMLQPGHLSPSRQPQRRSQFMTTSVAWLPVQLSSAALAPHVFSHRAIGRATGAAAKSPQRTISVMQNAMKIPGLASALHFIGVNGGGGGPSGSAGTTDSMVAAAGGSGTGMPPRDYSPSPSPANTTAQPQPQFQSQVHQHQQQQKQLDRLPNSGRILGGKEASSTATVALDGDAAAATAAAAAAAANSGNNHLPSPHPPHIQQQQLQQLQPEEAQTSGVRQINGHATNAANATAAANGVAHPARAGRQRGEEGPLSVLDPPGKPRTENNIMPYTGSASGGGVGGSISLATQIRDIASSLRQINAMRMEYLGMIEQQEFELAAKDQVLRSREERIQSLEQEAAELRRTVALLTTARAAAEAEVQRLRTAANTSAAAATLTAPAAAPPPTPLPPAPAPAPAAAPQAILSAAAPPPPPPATATSAPAPAASTPPVPPTPAPMPAPPPTSAPPPPPPPRVPDIVLSYRSSWPEAFLHCNVEGRGWTAVPGLRMEHSGSKEYLMHVQGRSLEFVLTNGQGEWDSPGGGGIGRNYHINAPGEYRLHYGVLTQVKPWQP